MENPTPTIEYVNAEEALRRFGIRSFNRKCRSGEFPGAFKASRGEGWRAPVESLAAWCRARVVQPRAADDTPLAASLSEYRASRGQRGAA